MRVGSTVSTRFERGRAMKLMTLIGAALVLVTTSAAGSVITPAEVISEEYVFNSAVNTINNVGMITPVYHGDDTAAALDAVHVHHGGYTGSFATTAPGGGGSDFFASIGGDTAVEIVYDLTGGGDTPVDSMLVWQYENSGGGPDRVGNHARTIEIRINTEADGSTQFGGPPITVTLLPVTDGDADAANDLNGVNSAQAFELGELSGRYAKVSINDNYYGLQGMVGGGDRVGLGEIRFASVELRVAPPVKAWLMAIHAHPDDEGIFFGGVLPYYAQTLELPVVLVNMTTGWLNADGTQTTDSYTRQAELTEAAVRYGLNVGPVFALFQQTNWNLTIDNSWDRWADYVTDGDDVAEGQRRASRRLAELIRKYRPEVIATHDFDGEYGHPDHKALAFATAAAWDLAAGREAVIDDGVTPATVVTPDGLAGAPWEARKLYVHSYGQGRLFHDHWEAVSIDSDDDGTPDQTPREVANYALSAHVSQGGPHVATVYDPLANGGNSWDDHPSEWWGLYASAVGPDDPVADFVIEGRVYSGWARGDFTARVPVPVATDCSVDVAILDFGVVPVGEQSFREFVITNTGLEMLSGTVVLVGNDCESFTIVPGTESYELGWSDTHTVTVVFTATSNVPGPDCRIDTGSEFCGEVLLSGAVSDVPDAPAPFRLLAYPNPFNPQTTIAFDLPGQATVSLRVFDVAGRLVKTLIGGEAYPSGRHETVWNGRDGVGRQMASGTYFYRLEAGEFQETKRMVLIK